MAGTSWGATHAVVGREWSERAAAWRRWAPRWAPQTGEATRLIVEAADLREGDRVLDLASGGGEPALTLAAIVGSRGRVTATDLSAEMLAIASAEARVRGLSNLACMVAAAEHISMPDRSVDAVTCRFGIAHFADPAAALRDAYRVLVSGGRAVFLVWGPRAHNPFFTIVDEAFAPYPLEQSAPAAPGPFTFAAPGSLAAALRAAGFGEVREETRALALAWPGSAEEMWAARRDMSAAVGRNLARLTEGQRAEVDERVITALRGYDDGRQVTLPASVVLATGRR